jgi:dTDP-4-dehydrorhamnose 3,5-epimerase-like enzyme
MNPMLGRAIHFASHGSLTVFERITDFNLRRVFALSGVKKKEVRGNHAHKQTTLILVPLAGSCTVHLDDGQSEDEVVLSKKDEGLMIYPHVWHSLSKFSKDAVIMVLADTEYDEKDYIRDHSEFLAHLPIEGVPGY